MKKGVQPSKACHICTEYRENHQDAVIERADTAEESSRENQREEEKNLMHRRVQTVWDGGPTDRPTNAIDPSILIGTYSTVITCKLTVM